MVHHSPGTRKTRWVGTVAGMIAARNTFRDFGSTNEGKRQLGITTRKWEENIK
jgi:hypothetical protein